MPKPPPEPVEDFTITIRHVPKVALGDLHAALAKLDLHHVETQLVAHIAAFAQRSNHSVKAEDFLAEWIKDNATFKAKEAVNHFEADGRTGGACYSAIKTLVQKRALKKLGDGNYSRSDVRQLVAPKKAKAEPRKTFDKSGSEVILSYARRNHGRFTNAKLYEIFEKEGRASNSVSASIAKLLNDRMIKRVGVNGSGQYVLLNKGQTERKKALMQKAEVKVETVEESNG